MNTVISIIKGLGIILMVMGHAEVPDLLSNFIYIFHMPLFFIAAGYFFSRKHLDNPWEFCRRRFKGLYVPFLKWSVIFLILHNLWFEIGILNEQYGNWQGGVTHPYSIQDFFTRVFRVVTSMSGYDEFLTGAFWFFRGLLVASILYLVLARVIDGMRPMGMVRIAILICAFALAFNAYRFAFGLKVTTIPNGGLRDIWGLFFFGVGVIYKHFETRIGDRPLLTVCCLSVLCVCAWFHTCGMNNNGKMLDLLTLPVTGTAGWIFCHHLAVWIDSRDSLLRRSLLFIGNNTLYVFIFHIISFKLVSPLKILWYGLDWGQMGCHMVIHYNNHTDLFWILYTAAGVGVPMLCLQLYRRLAVKLRPQPAVV